MSETIQSNIGYRCTYNDFPELYDILYQRYFASIPRFVEVVSAHVAAGSRVLDMAAGTGEVTLPLLAAGYDVTSVDKSSGMLEQLRGKARARQLGARTVVADMMSYQGGGSYDAVAIRQAINYADSPAELLATLQSFYDALQPGGVVVCNAPNYHEGRDSFATVANQYSTQGGLHAVVVESNMMIGRRLRHRQESLVWEDMSVPRYVQDENTFYMFTADELRTAAEQAGFRTVRLFGRVATALSDEDKTIYGVFVK